MNSRRPEKVRYVPPNRRKHSIAVVPSVQVPPPPPPVPYPGSIDSPTSKHSVPVHPRLYEPSTPPPMRPEIFKAHSHTRPAVQRRDSYDPSISPPRHRRGDGRVEVRDHVRLRSTDSAYDRTVVTASLLSGKYGAQPTHLSRNRSYEEYVDMAPPPTFRRQATAPDWIESAPIKGTPTAIHPVRILRNPDRERNREFTGERATRAFAPPPRPERSYTAPVEGAGFVGDNIHSLTPSTSLEERIRRFVHSLNPDRPDPPEADKAYEYPDTTPDPTTTVPRETKTGFGKERSGRMGPDFRSHSDFFVPPKIMRRDARTRGPKHRYFLNDYNTESNSDEDCVRGMYRLHT